MDKYPFVRRKCLAHTNDVKKKKSLTTEKKQGIFSAMKKRTFLNEKGASTASSLFWIVFLGLSIYIGYLFVPPYLKYYVFKTHVEDEAKLGHAYDDVTLAKRMYRVAVEWDVPIELKDISIIRSNNNKKLSVTVYYVVTVNAAGLYQRDLEYFIDVTQPVMESSGSMF